MEKDELSELTSFLRNLRKKGIKDGVSPNAIRFLEIVLCRLYNSDLDADKIRETLSDSKKTIVSEFLLSPEEEEYIESFF